MENRDVLEYKNFHLFYKTLYERMFELINVIIDEKQYNIEKVKNRFNDFLDSYSYYIIQKKLITKEEQEIGPQSQENILNNLKEFDKFTEGLNKFPSKDYNKTLEELKSYNYDVTKLSFDKYQVFMQEYYTFFNDAIMIFKLFIDITSKNGFLPNIKNRVALKTIGYANYDLFFVELENLKTKMSEETNTVHIKNIFKSRRCVFTVLVIFSPYFQKFEILDQLVTGLDFKFLDDAENVRLLKKALDYDNLNQMGTETANKIRNEVLKPLQKNISLIKRYISYEFGERDLSPRLNRKYAFDPTGV